MCDGGAGGLDPEVGEAVHVTAGECIDGPRLGIESCTTGMSAAGYMAINGMNAPWSRPRLLNSCTVVVSENDLTKPWPRAVASGVAYGSVLYRG